MPYKQNLGNGKYRVWVFNGTDPITGKPIRKSKIIEAKSDKDAEKKAAVFENEFRTGNQPTITKAMTFYELVEKWRYLKEINLAHTTRNGYENTLKHKMLPYFGNYRVESITPLHIDEYLKSLKENGTRHDKKEGGYAQKTIQHHYVLLSRLLSFAVTWGYISSNPCKNVERPKVDESEAEYYEIVQIVKMLSCFKKEYQQLENAFENSIKYKYKYTEIEALESKMKRMLNFLMHRLYVHIALVSACRRSEVLGLEKSDIDYDNNQIKVCRTSHYTGNEGLYTKEKKLKNGKPSKTITMPVEVMDMIKEYEEALLAVRMKMGDRWKESNRLFIAIEGGSISEPGTAIMPDNISQWFERFLVKHNLPKITLHQVRHTSISYLLNSGVDLETVADLAGHENSNVTSGIYGHVFSKNKREAADKFSQLLAIKADENDDI